MVLVLFGQPSDINNLIILWGSKDNYQSTFVFPLAFSNTTYTIVTSCKNTTASNWETPTNCTQTGFNILFSQAATYSIPVNYVAIGY